MKRHHPAKNGDVRGIFFPTWLPRYSHELPTLELLLLSGWQLFLFKPLQHYIPFLVVGDVSQSALKDIEADGTGRVPFSLYKRPATSSVYPCGHL